MLIRWGHVTTTALWCVLIRGQLLGMCLVVFDCRDLSLWVEDMIHICPAPDMSDHVVMMTKQSSLSASSNRIARKFCYSKVNLGAEDCHLPPWSLDLTVASFLLSNLRVRVIFRLIMQVSLPELSLPILLCKRHHTQTRYSTQPACVIHIFTVQLCGGAIAPFLPFSSSVSGSVWCRPLNKPSSCSIPPVSRLNALRSPQSPWHRGSSNLHTLLCLLISIPVYVTLQWIRYNDVCECWVTLLHLKKKKKF